MIVQNPGMVRFGSFAWESVPLVAVERVGTRVIEEHDDRGPFAAFVDVAEQSVNIRVQRTVAADDLDEPALGMAGELVFFAAPPTDERRRRRITISCVVVGIRVEPGTGGRGPTTTIVLRGATTDGGDPVVIEAAGVDEA